MQNPNLVYSIYNGEVEQELLNKTFFYNQVAYSNRVNYCKEGDFLVNKSYVFHIDKQNIVEKHNNSNHYNIKNMLEVGTGKQIPLWLFGFLH